MKDVDAIIKFHAKGHSLKECGERFGCSGERIRQILKKHKVPVRRKWGKKPLPLNPEQKKQKQLAKLWSKIDFTVSTNDCWLWTGKPDANGYGRVYFHEKKDYAHRVVYFLIYGRWPSRLVRHSCDVRLCCNWHHLIEGTHQDNINDRELRGRGAWQKDPDGQKQKVAEGTAKARLTKTTGLNKVKVLDIKNRLKNKQPVAEIARLCPDVSLSAIYDVASGRSWKNI